MTLARLLSETVVRGLPTTGDLLAVGLPFLRQLADLHEQGLVSRLHGAEHIDFTDDRLRVTPPEGTEPALVPEMLERLNPERHRRGVAVTARLGIDQGDGQRWDEVRSRDVLTDLDAVPDRPVLVVGYRAWEARLGHHDVLTDIHLAGLVLTSFATGLDLDNPDQLSELALARRRLPTLTAGVHPVVTGVLAEMIDPDRHERPPDLRHVIARLEHHRDLPADLDLSDALADPTDWRPAVLRRLRERVFDTTRRNRALYFRPSVSTVSLTEASVPLMLNVDRITADDVLTWSGDAAAVLSSGKSIDLERWCRFEDAPHITSSLDKLMAAERKFVVEHGAGRLRLVTTFLHWTDPDTGHPVSTPLTSYGATLTRQKGVKPRYRVTANGDHEVNPILRFVFRQRFDVVLPETVGPDLISLRALTDEIQTSVRRTDPAVRIELVDTPRIQLIQRRARLRLDNYRRRRAIAQASSGRWRRQDHSYTPDDWRPLGLALVDRFVLPEELPLRSIAGADARPRGRPQEFSADDTTSAPGSDETADDRDPSQRARETYSLTGRDTHAQRWEVDLCAVTLATLGTRRTTLSRDYDDLLGGDEAALEHPPFVELFRPGRTDAPSAKDPHPRAERQGVPLVLPADDAQIDAVARALDGDSFIVQGPPGTGKSQTIANMIAALVADGRRVLFVCEKRAALDVVAHRLDQVGLGDLVATIHDTQADRKPFVQALGRTYESWLASAPSGAAENQRVADAAALGRLLRPPTQLRDDLHRHHDGQPTTAQLLVRAAALRHLGAAPGRVPSLGGGITAGDWFAARRHFDAVRARLRHDGLDDELGRHDILRLRPDVLADGDVLGIARRISDQLVRARANAPLDDALPVAGLADLQSTMRTVSPLIEAGAAGVLDPTHPAHQDLRRASEARIDLERRLATSAEVLGRWFDPLDAADTRAALEVARGAEGSLRRFFNSRWKQVEQTVRSAYRFDLHQVAPTVTSVLTELDLHHTFVADAAHRRATDTARFGTDDVVGLVRWIDHLHSDRESPTNAAIRSLLVTHGTPERWSSAISAVDELVVSAGHLLVSPSVTVGQLGTLAEGLRTTGVAHEAAAIEWCRLAGTPEAVLGLALGPYELNDLDARICVEDLERRHLDGLSPATGAEADDLTPRVLDAADRLRRSTAAAIVERTHRRFTDEIAHSDASMAGRSDEDKERKRRYNAGRRLLEREFAKKMRFRALRELADAEPGEVVRDLRPIWLMSPLSVSDSLPLRPDLFDTVIFDEASQIPVEDAVPTVFRAPQVIVVGDRMQMPPTRFFSSDDLEDDDVVVDAEGFKLTVTLDADSFLAQADASLDSSMLSWHYRSRSESLIAYSNNAFYRGELATIPDRDLPNATLDPIEVGDPDDGATNAARILDRPISFHRLRNGIYEHRQNQPEADYIAELVRALIAPTEHPTIGIVAFSEAQQTAIESSLAELATVDENFGARLADEEQRRDDGEYVGLFVKNLENVQGDERDVIIMSVCYGPDSEGSIRMNFGPINQGGGERRLNVIFSRAKRHMAVVASMSGASITNTHNDGANHLAQFLTFAEAESRGDLATSSAVLREQRGVDVTADLAAPDRVAHEVSAALVRAGHRVDLGVGRSDFRLDLAIRDDEGYVLGVLLEPGERDALSTYVSEAGVLDAFGWQVTRVPLHEWWRDPDTVIERIDARVRRLSDRGSA